MNNIIFNGLLIAAFHLVSCDGSVSEKTNPLSNRQKSESSSNQESKTNIDLGLTLVDEIPDVVTSRFLRIAVQATSPEATHWVMSMLVNPSEGERCDSGFSKFQINAINESVTVDLTTIVGKVEICILGYSENYLMYDELGLIKLQFDRPVFKRHQVDFANGRCFESSLFKQGPSIYDGACPEAITLDNSSVQQLYKCGEEENTILYYERDLFGNTVDIEYVRRKSGNIDCKALTTSLH